MLGCVYELRRKHIYPRRQMSSSWKGHFASKATSGSAEYAAHVVMLCVSSEIMKCRLSKGQLDHPTKNTRHLLQGKITSLQRELQEGQNTRNPRSSCTFVLGRCCTSAILISLRLLLSPILSLLFIRPQFAVEMESNDQIIWIRLSEGMVIRTLDLLYLCFISNEGPARLSLSLGLGDYKLCL